MVEVCAVFCYCLSWPDVQRQQTYVYGACMSYVCCPDCAPAGMPAVQRPLSKIVGPFLSPGVLKYAVCSARGVMDVVFSDCTVTRGAVHARAWEVLVLFISDHRALHASLQCIRPHPVRKQISVRAIRRIKDDAIVKDLDKFSIDQRCVDVDTIVEMYDRFLSELLDKHAPLKMITVVVRPLNEWMTNNILALKAICRKNESRYRQRRMRL